MFDTQAFDSLRQDAERVAAARSEMGLATGAQARDALRAVQRVQDVLDGVHAALLSQVESSEAYAEEGASSTAAWVRRELRMPAGEASRRRRAGQTLAILPDVAAALAAGRIRLAHVYEFTSGITKLGAEVMVDAQEILLPVAESCDPMVLRELISELHAVIHPDDLDDKYAKGMDRADIKAAKCGQGWHLSGFLPQHVGVKLNEWLRSVSAPEGDGDNRAPSQRRVDGLERLLDGADGPADAPDDTAAESEQPAAGQSSADQAHAQSDDRLGDAPESRQQPQSRRRGRADTRLLVLADLETLLRMPGAGPAMLAGFGPIGQQLLGYLTCGADLTGILKHGMSDGPVPQAKILNVGWSSRLATARQRHAVIARQDGVCAAPGCGLTRLDVHHVAWWHRDGGRTDLSNLVGLCSRCHHLVHQERLIIEADGRGGFVFRRQTGRIIDDHARLTRQRVRGALATLRHILRDEHADPADPRPATAESVPAARPAPRLDSQWLTRIDPDRLHSAERQLYEFIGHHHPRRT